MDEIVEAETKGDGGRAYDLYRVQSWESEARFIEAIRGSTARWAVILGPERADLDPYRIFLHGTFYASARSEVGVVEQITAADILNMAVKLHAWLKTTSV